MGEIKTRTFNYGNECESEWPPMFGTCQGGYYGHWDKEKKCLVEGPPPPREIKYGEAPMIIMDTIPEYYHPAAETYIDSRSKLRQVDKACGTITTDKLQPADSSYKKELERKRREDIHQSMHKAVAQIDAGTAPLSEETRALCERQNEIVSSALNFDAFNVAGRKKNGKGKRFRKR